jgi:hypothetical protein
MMVEDIGEYLAPLMSKTLGVDMFLNWQPESPDQTVVLSDYSHDAPDVTMGASIPTSEHPRLQVMVRDLPSEVVACHTACRSAYVHLCGVQDEVLGDNRYTLIPLQTPTMIGRDTQQRVLYVVNFQVSAT